VKRKTVFVFIFIVLLIFYQSYNQTIIKGLTVIERDDNVITKKITPIIFKKECGNTSITFISYLSPSKTEKQTKKICEIFLNKKDR
jgi:hypothetical protein